MSNSYSKPPPIKQRKALNRRRDMKLMLKKEKLRELEVFLRSKEREPML